MSDSQDRGDISISLQSENRPNKVELVSEYKADIMQLSRARQDILTNFLVREHADQLDSKRQETAKLMDYQELERKRISRELHDGLGQLLTNIKLRVQQCVSELKGSGKSDEMGDTWDSIEQLPAMVSEAIQEVRNICSALRPAMLDDLGVLAAISWQCRQCRESMPRLKTEIDFFVEESEIPESFKTNLYRITQEALNNAVKYSDADVIRVNMHKEQNILYLSIEDNGKGFSNGSSDPQYANEGVSGLGMTSMRERAESMGGTFIIESNENIGTNVQVALPIDGRNLSS